MYRWVRQIHLFTGMSLLLFVLLYFLTGYVMIHAKWFGKSDPKTIVRTEAVAVPTELSDDALGRWVQQRFELGGQGGGAVSRSPDGSRRLGYNRPGTTIEVVVAADGRHVTITEKQMGFTGTANGFHRLRGYRGGPLYVTWAVFYDLASAALILFAITGVWLWFKSTTRRWPGLLCLLSSFGFTAGMVIYLIVRR